MPLKKTTTVYRTNLVNVGIGQGNMETLPYLFNITEYDPKGQTLSQSSFSADGLLSEKMVWEYDGQEKIAREIYFSEEGDPSEIVSFERDSDGLVLRDVKKYLDDSEDITTYHYDDQRHLLEKVTVTDEGITDLVEKFGWKEDRLARHEILDGEGNTVSLDEFVYDNGGNILEHKRSDEETGEYFRKVVRYNGKGHKLSEKVFAKDDELLETIFFKTDHEGRVVSIATEGPEKISTTLFTYDERGNITSQEESTPDGNQLLWAEHTWDEQNNLLNSRVFIKGRGNFYSQHYELTYEYEWFDKT